MQCIATAYFLCSPHACSVAYTYVHSTHSVHSVYSSEVSRVLRLAVTSGNFSSFLFQLAPSVAVHPPSGANQNFQYCGHNFASLPNGIGFGGQVGHASVQLFGWPKNTILMFKQQIPV